MDLINDSSLDLEIILDEPGDLVDNPINNLNSEFVVHNEDMNIEENETMPRADDSNARADNRLAIENNELITEEKIYESQVSDKNPDQIENIRLTPPEIISIKDEKEIVEEIKVEETEEFKETKEIEVQEEINPTDILCFKLFSNVLDTAQSTKIYKFLSHNEPFEILEKQLHDEFKIIGLYGETQTIFNFLEKLFGKELPKVIINEGIYLYYDICAKKAAIVFFTNDASIYKNKPISTSNRANTIVRILSDLCLKIVACIPNDIIENWYYEDKGKKNPFIPKTHVIGGSKLEIIKIYESSLEKIHVKRSKFEYPNCYFPKDSSN